MLNMKKNRPLTEKEMKSIPPAPFKGVFTKKLRRDDEGKVMLNALGERIIDLIPVMTYDPSTKKKVQKMERGSYSNSALMRVFNS